MVDIFDEVSEDLRTERAMALAKRYGGLLIIAAVAVLAGIAGFQAYNGMQREKDARAAGQYLALTTPLDEGTTLSATQLTDAAIGLKAFAASAPEGYKTLASLRAAALEAGAGDITGAQALWLGISDDSGADEAMRNSATLLWAQRAIGSVPDGAVEARLKPLEASANPFHAMAQEDQALLYLKDGKPDLAKALFSQLASDPNAPPDLRNRAGGLLAQLNG